MAAAVRICRAFFSSNTALYSPRKAPPKVVSSVQKSTPTSNITYEIKPERLQQIQESPSGWVPPAAEKPNLPFFIKRSKYNNLPVYTDYRSGGSRKLTIIRKIKGDLKTLDDCLKYHLGNDIMTSINELTSQVKIRGIYKDEVVTLLKRLGY
ncbi:hypothetical protein ACROYT_G041871 [Oculina patagonica]